MIFSSILTAQKGKAITKILLHSCVIIIILSGIALAADRDVIIGYKKPVGVSEKELVNSHSGKVKKDFHIINAVSASVPEAEIENMKKDSNIKYIVNDSVFQAVDEYSSAWGVKYIGSQTVHNQGINGSGVKIAVLDTGIDYTHPDLAGNYKGGFNVLANNSNPWDDNCHTGGINNVCHGTHVSGTIAAGLNGFGVVGVAPGASLYAVKVLNGGSSGTASTVLSGIEWAINNNMSIISMSIESAENNTAVFDAVNVAYNSGILLVAAGGNTVGNPVLYPAAYDNVIAVTAIDQNDQIASFSPIDQKIELAAPGVQINSTICVIPDALATSCLQQGYGFLSGTSMAAPHVTGVAALIFSTNFPDVNNDGKRDNKDVRLILQNTARHVGTPGRNSMYGFGVVDASKALLGISTFPLIPVITDFAPSSPVNDSEGSFRAFNITISQRVNVIWYINGTQVSSNTNVTDANYTNTSASSGIWNVSAIATNANGSAMHSWIWNVTPIPSPPVITGFAPLSPVNDPKGSSRKFNITINQTVNVIWYVNGTQVSSNTSVTDASYTNTSAKAGIWNVSAIATNANGSVMHSWIWNVTPKLFPLDLTLARTNVSPDGDMQKVILSKGKYSINIHNVNLTEIYMKVYENGILQDRLSRDFEFDKKRKDIDFDLMVNNALVAFIPNGKKGSIAYIEIKRS